MALPIHGADNRRFDTGRIDMNNSLPVYEYAYFMEFLPYSLNPAGKNCLVIGLGAGIILCGMKNGHKTDTVDIDPNVVNIAKNILDLSYGER